MVLLRRSEAGTRAVAPFVVVMLSMAGAVFAGASACSGDTRDADRGFANVAGASGADAANQTKLDSGTGDAPADDYETCFPGVSCTAGKTCSYATDSCLHACTCSGGTWQCTTSCSNDCKPGVFEVGDCLRTCYCVSSSPGATTTECVENCGPAKACPSDVYPPEACSLPDGTACIIPGAQTTPARTCICRDYGSGTKSWGCEEDCAGNPVDPRCPAHQCLFRGAEAALARCTCAGSDAGPTAVAWSCQDLADGG